jgi:hypothetical protein
MKVGDLVKFCKCSLAGTTGIVMSTQASSPEFSGKPHLALTWVSISSMGGKVQCFSGSQLEVVNEGR